MKSGDTPLLHLPYLCDYFDLPFLKVKDESKNPFGTLKDRRSELIVKMASFSQVDKLALITSGNAGYSLAQYASDTDLKVICIVDKNTKDSIKETLKSCCYDMKEVDLYKKLLLPEDIIGLAREDENEVIWDVTSGYYQAYEGIVEELLLEQPDYIVTPLGSGECFVGLYSGIKKFNLDTTLVAGVSVKEKKSIASKLYAGWTPYERRIKSIIDEGHLYFELEEDKIHEILKVIGDCLDYEPSGVVGFGALDLIKLKKTDKVVVINTGKGIL